MSFQLIELPVFEPRRLQRGVKSSNTAILKVDRAVMPVQIEPRGRNHAFSLQIALNFAR
jgi:hypothetical protein